MPLKGGKLNSTNPKREKQKYPFGWLVSPKSPRSVDGCISVPNPRKHCYLFVLKTQF